MFLGQKLKWRGGASWGGSINGMAGVLGDGCSTVQYSSFTGTLNLHMRALRSIEPLIQRKTNPKIEQTGPLGNFASLSSSKQ
jgi:hypothetical protein